jgi:hypothetical protein
LQRPEARLRERIGLEGDLDAGDLVGIGRLPRPSGDVLCLSEP